MGKAQNSKNNSAKRILSDDEISPNSKREDKLMKMGLSDEELKNMADNVAKIMVNMEKIKMLDDIKSSQDKLTEAFHTMNLRVADLEKKVEEINESREIDTLREELNVTKGRCHILEQANVNNKLFVRNLPLEIIGNDMMIQSTVNSILNTIGLPNTYFDGEARKAANNQTANILLTFATDTSKAKVLRKFKSMRKDQALGSSLLVEKHITLAQNHPLNGIKLSMANKLTAHNTHLINEARKFVPSHFMYVFDSPEGMIKAKINKDVPPVTIRSVEDMNMLVEKVEADRRRPSNASARETPVNTRSRGGKK